MVTKAWNNCFPEYAATQQIYRYNFYLCQWQRDQDVGILYLIYRWLSAILFLAVLSCSLLDIGRSDETRYEHHYAKWWIYLANWGLVACAIQAWLGAMIVTQGMMVDRDDYGMQRQVKESWLHQAYWVLYTIATVYSFIITICYWVVVIHDSVIMDAVNLMVHVLNSIIMLIDLMIVGHPIKMTHAYWTMGIGLVYAIFSVVYFIAGGTTRQNTTTIYPLLDWSKPGKSIVVSATGILFVFVIHFIVFIMYRCRVCIFNKVCIRGHHDDDKLNGLSRTVSSLESAQKEQYLNPNNVVELKM